MKQFLDELARRLEGIESLALRRVLKEPAGIDFASNDYLGLSRHPVVRERLLEAVKHGNLAAPASRLLRGHFEQHAEIEERLARFKGTESALLFPSGYQANVALLTALITRQDRAVSDALNHASVIDGLRLSGCAKAIYPHGDVPAAERLLGQRHDGGRNFLVTESYFGVEGDVAPLDALAAAAERNGALLIVDDAHATGLHGDERGSGLCERFGVVRRTAAILSTCGKALGLWGAFVAGPKVVIDALVNFARPFIFSTATSPLLAAGLHGALDVIERERGLRANVHSLSHRLRVALEARGLPAAPGEGPVVPVMLGENLRALQVAEHVQRLGFDVRAVRPPTVPPGTARLRVSVHADHTETQVDALAAAIAEAVGRIPPRARGGHR